MATGVISDFEINNFVRRELVVRRLDTSCLKFGTSGGVVYVNGTIKFIGTEVSVNEMPKYLYLLEQSVRGIRGVRNVKMEFEGWVKNKSGKWMQAKDDDKKKNNKDDGSSVSQGSVAPPPVQPEIPIKKPSINENTEDHNKIIVKSFPCRNCGHWILKGIDFCENCGSENTIKKLKSYMIKCNKCDFKSVKPVSGNCPECGEKLEQIPAEYYASKCEHCGYVKKWILNFCPECGFDLSKNDEPEEKPVFEEDYEETPVNEEKEISLKEKVKMLLEQEKEKAIQKKSKKDHEINDILGKI